MLTLYFSENGAAFFWHLRNFFIAFFCIPRIKIMHDLSFYLDHACGCFFLTKKTWVS